MMKINFKTLVCSILILLGIVLLSNNVAYARGKWHLTVLIRNQFSEPISPTTIQAIHGKWEDYPKKIPAGGQATIGVHREKFKTMEFNVVYMLPTAKFVKCTVHVKKSADPGGKHSDYILTVDGGTKNECNKRFSFHSDQPPDIQVIFEP